MNREIEFRGWLKNQKKMVEVVSINFNDRLIAYNDNDKQELCINCSFNNIELMQYTGIKDKNGVKIFEGDIVKIYEYDDIVKVAYDDFFVGFVVEYYNKYQAPLSEYTSIASPHIEVIGNIYENKELLEDE